MTTDAARGRIEGMGTTRTARFELGSSSSARVQLALRAGRRRACLLDARAA